MIRVVGENLLRSQQNTMYNELTVLTINKFKSSRMISYVDNVVRICHTFRNTVAELLTVLHNYWFYVE